MAVFGILTVCTGNICRSPLAELLLQQRLADIRSIELASAGTQALEGAPMPEQGARIARELGLDPDGHRGKYLEPPYIAMSDLILTMSREHRAKVVSQDPRALNKTFTLREFARLTQGVTDEDVLGMTQGADSSAARLSALVGALAARRGAVAAPSAMEDDDIVDPYRRSDETYRRSAEELVPSAERVAAVLRIAALGAPAAVAG